MADTDFDTRTSAQFEQEFKEAPRAQVPAEIQQVVVDERPRGAISVHVKRDLSEVLKQIRVIASAAGDDFFYSWPTKNKDGSRGVVEGPSVKCANAVARIYGNCSVKVRAFDQGATWIFYAQFYDLETGFVYERPFQQRKAQDIGGKMDRDRATDIVFQIGASKAARNAVTNALSEFTDFAFAVAKEQLVEKVGKDLPRHRARVLERLAELKVEVTRVEQVRGKVAASWLAGDVAKIIAEIQACNDGMAHPDELWPPPEAGAARPKPEDFQTGGENGPKSAAAASPASAQAETAARGPETAATAAPASAASSGAQDGKPAGAQQSVAADPPAGEQQGNAGDQVDAADREHQVALEGAEAWLLRQGDQLASVPAEELEEFIDRTRTTVRAWEQIDDEDRAVLLGRWNTRVLEHRRALAKRKPAGRR